MNPVAGAEESPNEPPNLKPVDPEPEVLSVVPNLKPPVVEVEDPKAEEDKAPPAGKTRIRNYIIIRSVEASNFTIRFTFTFGLHFGSRFGCLTSDTLHSSSLVGDQTDVTVPGTLGLLERISEAQNGSSADWSRGFR